MPENKPGGLKLKLRKADTSRLKTQTGRIKTVEDPSEADTQTAPAPPQAPAVPEPSQTAEISDPMALRDTSTGKLKRVQSPDETANAIAPDADDTGEKRETVRLKVVRDKKSGGPQVVPPTQSIPTPPPASDATAPSAQTVKISLPGLKKAPTPAAAAKSATSTVRVQEPPPEAGEGTPELGAGGTLRIKPGPALTAKPAHPEGEGSKTVTATLKIRPDQTEAAQPPPKPAEDESNKNITATLKIRPGGVQAADSASTVKITPPKPKAVESDKAGADTVVTPVPPPQSAAKPSLKLRKPGKPEADDSASTVRLPGIEPVADQDKTETVSLPASPAETAEDETAAEAGVPEIAAAPEAEAEEQAQPILAPKPASSGPGVFAFATSVAACAATGALLYRLVMDYLQHIK